ncbi:hypothetical protein PEBR_11340 [Penicillium brasilianum]|uniref:Orotidine 5'-phosphate decarboxylase n=2 Tax=Penicillium brasilianum TaxID=104259 RepID=A0A1S9RTD9_PENBI|nr:hypothetical protein PEBR_11340 [Penicillium brasilianum]
MVQITIPENYGAAIAVALGAIPVLGFVHGAITTSLRRAAKVPYPHCYATVEQCKENAKAEQFNCAQRAHSNFLENASQTMLFTLVAGLKYPQLAAGISAAWVLLRSLFLYGYVYSGKPQGKGRMLGGTFWFAQAALWGLSLLFVYFLILFPLLFPLKRRSLPPPSPLLARYCRPYSRMHRELRLPPKDAFTHRGRDLQRARAVSAFFPTSALIPFTVRDLISSTLDVRLRCVKTSYTKIRPAASLRKRNAVRQPGNLGRLLTFWRLLALILFHSVEDLLNLSKEKFDPLCLCKSHDVLFTRLSLAIVSPDLRSTTPPLDIYSPANPAIMSSKSQLTYAVRAESHPNPLARRLFQVAEAKKSNVTVSADVTTTKELLDLADRLGPYIAVIKTHIDILSDFSEETITGLKALATKHNFLIFEDRKFIDIGNTVQKQYHNGTLRISEWSHIINCSVLPGEGIVEALAQTAQSPDFPYGSDRGLLILAEMTSKGSLATGAYTSASVDYARKYHSFVLGFVSTRALGEVESSVAPAEGEDFVVFTTGVNLSSKGDKLGQQYQTPQSAIGRGADFIIAGRGIYAAPDPVEAAKQYQQQGWEAYLARVGGQ